MPQIKLRQLISLAQLKKLQIPTNFLEKYNNGRENVFFASKGFIKKTINNTIFKNTAELVE
jgi:hypothetical protein